MRSPGICARGTGKYRTAESYLKSINTTVERYRTLLEQVRSKSLVLPDCDLDTGDGSKVAEYSLADESYARLLAELSRRKFDLASTALRVNILAFYSNPPMSVETKRDQVRSRGVMTSLDQLRLITPAPDLRVLPREKMMPCNG